MRHLACVVGVLGALIGVPAAHAAMQYASPTGSDSAVDCTNPAFPCELQNAMAKAATDDTVQLAAGTYTENNGDGYELAKKITLLGAPGARPLLKSTMTLEAGLNVGLNADGATLQHLAFEAPLNWYALTGDNGHDDIRLVDVAIDTPGYCVVLNAGLVQDSSFRSAQADGQTCASFLGGGTVKNVSVETVGANTPGLQLSAGHTSEGVRVTATGTGVTLLGPGPHRRLKVVAGGTGIEVLNAATITDSMVQSSTTAVRSAAVATLRNVTAVGDTGLHALPGTVVNAPGRIVGTNVIARGSLAGAEVLTPDATFCLGLPSTCAGTASLTNSNVRTPASANLDLVDSQSGDPQFVSATDLHLQAGSPARDAGTSTGVDSTSDIDGDPRTSGVKVDIGADEYVAPAPTPTPTASPSPTATPTPTPYGDTTKPVISRGSDAARGGVAFTLSEAASVRATIARKRGKRFRRRGTQTVSAKQGANTVRLRLKGRKLAPGRYRVTLVATDAAGNTSAAVKVRLRVKRPR